jgi:PH (Pleckstrin Homology) domain-containing protein
MFNHRKDFIMNRYVSKRGLEIVLPVSIGLFAALMFASAHRNWFAVAIVFLVMLFVMHVFLFTYYEINGHLLRIKCGFLIDRNINIHDLVSVKETYNPLSAPATSLDRLELKFKGKDSILVSPQNKKAFINHLLAVDPLIQVQLRARKK